MDKISRSRLKTVTLCILLLFSLSACADPAVLDPTATPSPAPSFTLIPSATATLPPAPTITSTAQPISTATATQTPLPTATITPTPTQAVTRCPGAPEIALRVGDWAMVSTDPPVPNKIRSQPGIEGEILGKILPGESVRIEDGPTCADGYTWWFVSRENGQQGWTAEGDSTAYWLIPLRFGGPYVEDEHTLLLLHFDGDSIGAQGETGTARWVSFVPGLFGQGVLIDSNDTLIYPSAGNLNYSSGTIEFWVRFDQPREARLYDLFEFDGPDGGLQIIFHGEGRLNVLMRKPTASGETLTGIGTDTAAGWAEDWHHVAVAWEENWLALLVDGCLMDSSDSAATPGENQAVSLFVGSSPRGDWQAEAIFDELRISDIARQLDSTLWCEP